MTDQEKMIVGLLGTLWNMIVELPVIHPSDNEETSRDIHNIQNRIMARAEQINNHYSEQPAYSPFPKVSK
jgi:hypothetical protein